MQGNTGFLEVLDLNNGLNEPEFAGEEQTRVFWDAISATDRAFDVWDRIWEHQRERAGVGISQLPFLFSESVLKFFRRYVLGNNVARNSATEPVGLSLRHMLAGVYARLRDDIVGTAMPIFWGGERAISQLSS